MYCQCHFLWRKLHTTQFQEIDHVKNWFPFFLNAQQQRLVDRQIYVLAMQWRKLITQFSPKVFANSIAINRLLPHYLQTKLSKWELWFRSFLSANFHRFWSEEPNKNSRGIFFEMQQFPVERQSYTYQVL